MTTNTQTINNTSARTIVLNVEMMGPQQEIEEAFDYITAQGIYAETDLPVVYTLHEDGIDDYTEYDSFYGRVSQGGGVFRLGLLLSVPATEVDVEGACNITYALLRDFCNTQPTFSAVVAGMRAHLMDGALAHWDFFWDAPYEADAWCKCTKVLRIEAQQDEIDERSRLVMSLLRTTLSEGVALTDESSKEKNTNETR